MRSAQSPIDISPGMQALLRVTNSVSKGNAVLVQPVRRELPQRLFSECEPLVTKLMQVEGPAKDSKRTASVHRVQKVAARGLRLGDREPTHDVPLMYVERAR